MKKQEQPTNKFVAWIKRNSGMLLVFCGIIIIIFSVKTQTLLLTDETQTYTVELQYSLVGRCISALPMKKEAQPIVAEHTFFLGAMDDTAQKAAASVYKLSGNKKVLVYTSGYPHNNDKLVSHFCELFAANGITAEKLEAK